MRVLEKRSRPRKRRRRVAVRAVATEVLTLDAKSPAASLSLHAAQTPAVDAPSQPLKGTAMERAGSWARLGTRSALRRWVARQDPTLWLLFAISLLAFLPRIYGLNWDANN